MTDIWDDHERVFHYTGWGGLEGILRSQSFRAFHYQSLNDLTEVEHLRSVLYDKGYSIVNRTLRKWSKESHANSISVRKAGGLNRASIDYSRNMVDSFYQAAISSADGRDPFSIPFIVSFCAHTNHNEYIKNNGLLSMWRGYGADGGFALEIDTQEFWKWITTGDEAKFDYGTFGLGQVVYDDATVEEIFEEFTGIEEAFAKFIADELAGEVNVAGDIYTPFIGAITRYKHQGFAEESEVRIVAAPLPQRVLDQASKNVPGQKTKLKLFECLDTVEPPRLFITLRGNPDEMMPIKRIIVGPHRNQDSQEDCVRGLLTELGMQIVIKRSETPYVSK